MAGTGRRARCLDAACGKAVIECGPKAFGKRSNESVSLDVDLVATVNRNIDRIFDQAGKHIGEGLHKTYWQRLAASVDAFSSAGLEDLLVASHTLEF